MRVILPEVLARSVLRSAAEARETSTGRESSLRRASTLATVLGPFRGTAEDAGVSDGRIFVGEDGVDGVAGVTGFDELGAVVVVDSALVTKMAGFVEDEDMRRGLRAVGAADGLGFTVVNVGIAEMLVGYADFHFVEGVADVRGVEFIDTDGSGIVRLNGDKGATPRSR
jgi:hypothetical protein